MSLTITRLAAGCALLGLTASCAGSYAPIRPERITSYQKVSAADAPVEFSYQYGALLTNGTNKKYVKKERKYGYQTVAVRLKNNTASELSFGRDLELFYGDRAVMPVPAVQAANDMKQGVAIYLLYVLGIGRIGGTTDPMTGRTTGGTLFPWGPAVAAGNMLGASAANTNMRKEFVAHDLTQKIIRPGETVYAIVSLRETNVAPLRLTLRAASAAVAQPAAPVQAAPAATPQAAPAATPAVEKGSGQ